MKRVESVLGELDSARRRLVSEIEGMQEPRFSTRPPAGGWSVGQVFEHLTRSEDAVARGIEAVSAGKLKVERKPGDFFRRLLYTSGIYRVVQVRTRPALDPTESHPKVEALVRIAATRERLLAAIELGERRGLWSHHLRHPIFGPLTIAEMLEFLAYHEERHRLQIVHIKAALEKAGK